MNIEDGELTVYDAIISLLFIFQIIAFVVIVLIFCYIANNIQIKKPKNTKYL